MKNKRLFSFVTAIVVMFSICMALPMKISVPLQADAAIDVSNLNPVDSTYTFIKSVEGYSSQCFWDVKQWTIGYGNKCPYTHTSNGVRGQKGGHTISEAEARNLFSTKLSGYVNTLKSNCSGLAMTQNQFDALLSATYNHGNVNSCPLKYYLQGKLTESEAREQYYVWCINAGTADETGLRNRRKKEANLFFSSVPDEVIVTPTISTDKSSYIVGDTVNISWVPSPSGSNLSHYWLQIDGPDDWYPYAGTMNLNTSYSFVASKVGDYTIKTYATPKGSKNGEDSLTDIKTISVQPNEAVGHVMTESEAAGQTIPDGNYWIYSELNMNYFLDIPGVELSSSGTNVQMWIDELNMPSEFDVWTVNYLGNGFYKIKQYGTDLCLDVVYASINRGSNVQLSDDNSSTAQQWSITRTPYGYTLQARCNGFNLDVNGGNIEIGTNVQTWSANGSASQNFSFIPYSPDERPIEDGIYTVQSICDNNYYLDISGIPGEYHNSSNAQIWSGAADRFKIVYAGEGWYKIYEESSGLALEVDNGDDQKCFMHNQRNIQLYEDNMGRGQLWKIRKTDDGHYFLISKLSGCYLDLLDGKCLDGQNVSQVYYLGGTPQKWNLEETGHVMTESEAAGQTIPDGNYWIYSELNMNYFLDIPGVELSSSGTNVQMWIDELNMPSEFDVWTVNYLGNGFYKIKQYGTDLCLDVVYASINRGSNVQLSDDNSSAAQQWSITRTQHGYTLQARCNGFNLDVNGGNIEIGTNVQTWSANGSASQNFSFIPYSPNERPIEDGIYTIQSTCNDNYYLDISGILGEYHNGSNAQIWSGATDRFKIVYAGEGWYKIYEESSGLALGVDNGDNQKYFMNNLRNVQLYEDNTERGQLWKIRKTDDGHYFLISKLSGFYLDLLDGKCLDGQNISQVYYLGGTPQKWNFVSSIIKGDANNDKIVNVSDAVMLQKWLLGSGNLTNWRNVDLYEDGKIDVFDMIEMRKLIINSQSAQ
ncbi:MAG: RICIN domain-containing protein [Ruminococcus sp.]|nr:RICIN domain-containing protein [Ruminococcus sp.]